MLIDEQNGNVLPLLSVLVEGMLNGRCFRLLVDYQEVFLSFWRRSYMLRMLEIAWDTVDGTHLRQLRREGVQLQSPELVSSR
jgi:hypothetical protein